MLRIFSTFLILVFLFSSSIAPALAAVTYAYDANGNMTSDGTNCYEYNEANQLKKVKNCGNNQTIAEYVYDYQGNRKIKKQYQSGALQKTIYSPDDSYETVKLASNSATQNTSYYYANDQLIAKKNPDGTKQYVHNDHLGSTSVMTNQSGGLVESTTYDPWGEVKTGGTKSKFGYTGQEKDSETGLNYYNARYYNSHVRRFTQPDDIIQNVYSPQDLNRYSYVRNNPLKYTDPSGHQLATSAGLTLLGLSYLAAVVSTLPPPRITPKDVTIVASYVLGINSMQKQVAQLSNIVNAVKTSATTLSKSTTTPQAKISTGSPAVGNIQGLPPQIKNFNPNRNPTQDKKVPEDQLKKIFDQLGEDLHDIKGKGSSRYDIFNDDKGNLYQKPKNGQGEGEPLNINMNDFKL